MIRRLNLMFYAMLAQKKRNHYRFWFGLPILLLCICGWSLLAHAQSDPPIHPDGWDLSFGVDGIVNTDANCDNYYQTDGHPSFYIQSDDKILISMMCQEVPTLFRYSANGVIDTEFGTNGKITTFDSASYPITQSDGKIILAGYEKIARYTDAGVLDTSFGNSGFATMPFPIQGYDSSLQVQSNDQIILLGGNGIARFMPDGALDVSLNGVGYIEINNLVSKPNNEASVFWGPTLQFAVDADSRLLLAMTMQWKDHPLDRLLQGRNLIVRLQPDGSFDPTFANNGTYLVSEFTSEFDSPSTGDANMQLLVDDVNRKIIVLDGANRRLIRLLSNGELDSTFNSGYVSYAGVFLQDRQGYFIYGIHAYGYPIGEISRLLPDGSTDTSFGTNGPLQIQGGFRFKALQQDGSLIVAGWRNLKRNVKTKEYPSAATPTPTPLPSPTPTPTPLPPEQRSLALIYAVLDNNLGEEWTRLINNIEAGTRAGVDVRLLIDGPANGDAYVYIVGQDSNPYCPSIENPTCDGRYSEGWNFQRFFTEDTARPHALYQFLVDGFNAYPQAPQVSLTILGHGSGWGANALPAQPSVWRDQNDTLGGMLWDDHTGVQAGSRSLSTLALGQALHWATAETGRTINLLYLDGCSMGMSEVAYELRDTAEYLLASPNTDWATFAYDQLLPLATADQDGRALGEAWLAAESELLRSRTGYPFTLALTDLGQMSIVSATVSALADALQAALPEQRSAIIQAFAQSDRFDSNYDAKLDVDDTYLDLGDLAAQLQTVGLTNTAIISRAQAVQVAMSSVVIGLAQENGSPWLDEGQTWSWQNLGGLSIYAPLHEDEAKRRIYYNKENLSWAADTTWDEFLAAFWADATNAATTQADMPICHATTDGCAGLANPLPVQVPVVQPLFLPVVMR